MNGWADRWLAANQVTDMRSDPAESKLTVQTEEAGSGVLVPVSKIDNQELRNLLLIQREAFWRLQEGNPLNNALFDKLTSTMRALLSQATNRNKEGRPFRYIPIAPRDYTIYNAPHVEVPVICIHTKPERSWFLMMVELTTMAGQFNGAFGAQLGRIRVYPATDQGVFPFNIRTNWRALTNKKKLKEVKDAYQRLIG